MATTKRPAPHRPAKPTQAKPARPRAAAKPPSELERVKKQLAEQRTANKKLREQLAGDPADQAPPPDAEQDPGPQLAPNPCPHCGRTETVVIAAPTVPDGAPRQADPATGEPVEPGKPIHWCVPCGRVLHVFTGTVERALRELERRHANDQKGGTDGDS